MQIAVIVTLICLTIAAEAKDSDITKFMRHLGVIPDLIDEGPNDFLDVTYDNGVKADKGVELTPTQVKNQPKVTWKPKSNETYYTLIMTDPDAPSREEPTLKEWHHWLVVNIPGNDISKGEILAKYIGAGPPKDGGLHRYVFLLYEQQEGKQSFPESKLSDESNEGREKFSTKKFVKRHSFVEPPVAGNFFSAQYDTFSDELYAKLSQT